MDYYINPRWITISIPDGLLYQYQMDYYIVKNVSLSWQKISHLFDSKIRHLFDRKIKHLYDRKLAVFLTEMLWQKWHIFAHKSPPFMSISTQNMLNNLAILQ
jgi:hypothetical protein